MLQVGYFDKKQNQGKLILQSLSKCSFPRDQISSRAYKHVEVSKYHKIWNQSETPSKTPSWKVKSNAKDKSLLKTQTTKSMKRSGPLSA